MFPLRVAGQCWRLHCSRGEARASWARRFVVQSPAVRWRPGDGVPVAELFAGHHFPKMLIETSRPESIVDGRLSLADADFELKFTIDGRDVTAVRRWLESVCRPDPHFPVGIVRSIYFDTPELHSLREKINSDYLKTKIRLRWYEVPGRPVGRSFLEAKFRIGSRRFKVRLETRYSGSWLAGTALRAQALRHIPQKLRPAGVPVPSELCPILLIRYTRHRFIDPAAGVRISLDADISVPAVNQELLPRAAPVPLHTAVVEVKGQARELPPVIRSLADLGGRKTSFSKYRACYDHAAIGLG